MGVCADLDHLGRCCDWGIAIAPSRPLGQLFDGYHRYSSKNALLGYRDRISRLHDQLFDVHNLRMSKKASWEADGRFPPCLVFPDTVEIAIGA